MSVPYSTFLGYDKGEDGNLVINEKQAELVRRIYGMFLQGQSAYAIARILTDEGIPSPGGKEKWHVKTIKHILTNEKYKGDALLQKTYTDDFLTKRQKLNRGEVQQYYVKNNHEPIIDPDTFDMAQTLMQSLKRGKNRISCVHTFSSKIKCGECGGWYGSKVWHSTDKYRKIVWRCNHKFRNEHKCGTPHLTEDEIKQAFISAVNKMITSKSKVIADFELIKSKVLNTDELETEKTGFERELAETAELMQKCMKQNAYTAQNQREYTERYNGLSEQFDTLKARLDEVNQQIVDKNARKAKTQIFIQNLKKQDSVITEFDEDLWLNTVDFVTIYSKKDIRVTFKNGDEIKV